MSKISLRFVLTFFGLLLFPLCGLATPVPLTQFVVVGEGGVILTSPDGTTWTARTSGTAVRLRGVAARSSLVVAVGQAGTVLSSVDGITWASQTSGAMETLRGVAASSTRFVAVGGDSASLVRISDDGLAWSGATTVPAVGKLRAVAWGNSRFLAVGPNGAVLTSTDGATWTQQNANTTERLDGAFWTGSQFSVVSSTGKIFSSTDGVSWTSAQAAPPSWIESMSWNASALVTVGSGGKIKTSADAATWTFRTSGTTNTLHGVAWTGTFAAQTGDPVAAIANLRKLSVTGTTASSKVYDGTAVATPNTTSSVLSGVASGDTVTLDKTSVVGAFADRHVGTSKPITVSGFALGGAHAADYTIVQPTGLTGTITAKALTITGLTANNKVHDGTNLATLSGTPTLDTAEAAGSGTTSDGKPYTVDTVSVGGTAVATFASTSPATGIAVTVTGLTPAGTHSANYSITQPTGLTATILPPPPTVTTPTNASVGHTSATLGGNITSDGGLTITERGIVYAVTTTNSNPQISGTGVTKVPASGTSTGVFTTPVTGLTYGTGYSFAAYAINSSGTGYSSVGTFTTTTPVLAFIGSATALTVNPNSGAVDLRELLHVTDEITGRTITWSQNSAPSHGTLAFTSATAASGGLDITPGGTITYTPTTGNTAADSFIIQASDGTTTVNRTITVTFRGQGTVGGGFVAVGEAGTILTSPDGTTWTSRTSGTALRLRGVSANGNVLVAVGQSGTVLTSANSTTWTSRTSGVAETLRGVAASPTRFVAVGGDSGSIVRFSTDGITWSAATTVPAVGKLRAVAWGNGRFLAVGPSGAVLTSPDGLVWTQQNANTTERLDGAVWTGSQFSVVSSTGKLFTSADGTSWTSSQLTPPSWIESLTWSDAAFVAVGSGGKIKTTADAVAWTFRTSGTTNTLHSVTWSGVFVSQTIDVVAAIAEMRKIFITGTTAAARIYDGSAAAALNTTNSVLSGVATGDTVTLDKTLAAGAFADRHVANAKAITVTGFAMSGAHAADYTLVQPTGLTANVTAKALTISGLSAVATRVYDGTTSAGLTGTAALLTAETVGSGTTGDGTPYSVDTITLSGPPVGVYCSRDAGSGKTVTVTGLSVTGTHAANYSLTAPTFDAAITTKALTVTGLGAVATRVYDGTVVAGLTGTAAFQIAQAAGAGTTSDGKPYDVDSVMPSGTALATFASRHVENAKPITVTGITLTGTGSSNYTVTQPAGLSAHITPKALTVGGLSASSRVYDGTLAATLNGTGALATPQAPGAGSTTDGVPYTGDTVSISGTASGVFADRHVGNNKAVTVSGLSLAGAELSNYSLAAPTGLTANITPKTLNVVGLSATDRVYDGTTVASIAGTAALMSGSTAGAGSTTDGRPYTVDSLSLTGTPAGAFATRTVGAAKAVTVTGLTIGTTGDAANYTLVHPTDLTAGITPKTLTVAGLSAPARVYDATTVAPLAGTAALQAAIAAGSGTSTDGKPYAIDSLALGGTAAGEFLTRHAALAKAVTVTGLGIGTTGDAVNYTLTHPSDLTAEVTPKPLTVSGVSASAKIYDATTFAALTGTPALEAPEAVNTGTTADGKPYTGDAISLIGTMSGAFTDRHAAAGKTVTVTGLSLDGAEKDNYSVAALTATASITAKALTISGVTASGRIYDATTVAPLGGTAALAPAIAPGSGTTTDGAPFTGDTVTTSGTPAGAFLDRHVAENKPVTVTGFTLSGAEKDNYTPTQPAGLTATITAKTLTISGVTATDRVYDATTLAPLTGTPALATAQAPGAGTTTDGVRYTGDTVAIAGTASGEFANRHVASAKPVTVTGLSLTGSEAANYVPAQPAGLTAAVTVKTLTSSGLAAVTRIYDGTTVAPLTGTAILASVEAPGAGTPSDGRPYTGDTLSISGTAAGAYADRHVATGKAVTISGLALAGAENGNYLFTVPAGVTGAVTTKALSVQGVNGVNKTYDATNTASLSGTAALLATENAGTGSTSDGKPYTGDAVALGGTAVATFADKLIGSAKPITVTGLALTGAQSANYSVTPPGALTASITAKNLTVTGAVVTARDYNYGTNATLNFTGAQLVGIAGSDTVTLVTTAATGTYASASAGTGIGVTVAGLTLGGTDAPNYTLTQPGLTGAINKATAPLALGALIQVFDGTPRRATATTTPAGLVVGILYDGSGAAPTNAGSYGVVAAINDPNFTGTASGTLVVVKATQTITFAPPATPPTIGIAFPLSATANSGLAVTFSVVSGGGTLSGSSLTLTGAGPVVVRATQAGNANYDAATADRTFIASGKQGQSISFAALPNRRTGDAPFALTATASSGLPVSFVLVSGPALLSGNTLTLSGVAGTVVVRATQAGNAVFDPAPDVTQSFTVIANTTSQVFFGLTSTSDTIAVELAPDGRSGTLLCYLAATQEAFIVRFTVNTDGTFDATVTPFAAPAPDARLEAIADGSVTPQRPEALPRTFRGQLRGGSITGSIVELGVSFTTNMQPAAGPTASIAGLYQSSSLNSASGTTASIVGTQGQVLVVSASPQLNTGGVGTVSSGGTFSVAAPGATISGAVDATNASVTGTVAVPNQPPIAFSGIATTVQRTDRLINLSSRARIGPAAGRTLITGFVIGGADAKRVLLRAIGPTLGGFGVGGALSNPRLQLYNSAGRIIAENDDWSGSDTATATAQVGAFALSTGSRDAALVTTLTPGAYTMHVIDGGETGVALAEIYDASANPSGDYHRLVNISSRGTVESGDGVLIGGFVVTGNSPKKLLVRGVGPALAAFGLTGTLADPTLAIYQNGRVIARNNDWSAPIAIDAAQLPATAAEVTAAANATGAFAFAANSRDSAIVITLAPGAYTAQVATSDTSTGIALVEIYEIPE